VTWEWAVGFTAAAFLYAAVTTLRRTARRMDDDMARALADADQLMLIAGCECNRFVVGTSSVLTRDGVLHRGDLCQPQRESL
jgi:hypothetical protein